MTRDQGLKTKYLRFVIVFGDSTSSWSDTQLKSNNLLNYYRTCLLFIQLCTSYIKPYNSCFLFHMSKVDVYIYTPIKCVIQTYIIELMGINGLELHGWHIHVHVLRVAADKPSQKGTQAGSEPRLLARDGQSSHEAASFPIRCIR